jgi:hypothetical protein
MCAPGESPDDPEPEDISCDRCEMARRASCQRGLPACRPGPARPPLGSVGPRRRGWTVPSAFRDRPKVSENKCMPPTVTSIVHPFAFRVRAYAAAHFEIDDHVELRWPGVGGIVQSEYSGGEDGRAYAVTLHAEVRGLAESIDQAQEQFGALVAGVFPLISVAANAAIADPIPVAAYGLDLTTPQPYVAYQTPPATAWFPPGTRRIAKESTIAYTQAVATHAQTAELHRANESYRRAIGHLFPEERLLAGEYAFIATETLSRGMHEAEASARGELVANIGHGRVRNELAEIRRDRIFDGDEDALRAIERASHGFEHGHMRLQEVLALIKGPELERSLAHIRRALIEFAGLDAASQAVLAGPDFETPRSLVPPIRGLTGQIRTTDPQHPPQLDSGAVEIEWSTGPPIVERQSDGDVRISFPTTSTLARVPTGVEVELSGHVLRAAHVKDLAVDVGEVHRAERDGDVPPER